MYSYDWDEETGGLLLNSAQQKMSKEPRPVYYKELDILGFDKYWNYAKDDSAPYMWAEANNYWYHGRKVASVKGGTLYTAPELVLLEEPEPDGKPLIPVNIPLMVAKNHTILEALVQDTIKKVFNIYISYRKKVDIFYVAFSGGKDSVVALDIVQRALPHNEFKVVFGNTDMEFPTTTELVQKLSRKCSDEGIEFLEAASNMTSKESWNIFGPPARKVRWCCTVHKTAPVINMLSDKFANGKLRCVMITGVRGDESVSRSGYDEMSMGKKMAGQYSFHPILEWSSAEIYLYIYSQGLLLNNAYKYGFNRVGCIMCPNSSEKHEYIKRQCFPELVDEYCERITQNSAKDLSGDNAKIFLETGGWKSRLSGRELKFSEEDRFQLNETPAYLKFSVNKLNPVWKTWYKTMGIIEENSGEIMLEYNGVWRKCRESEDKNGGLIEIENLGNSKNSIEFIFLFKSVLAKSQYCIFCKTCVAECPHRNISMSDGKITISDKCIKCHECLKILSGCLYYNSIRGSKAMKSLKGINKYLSVGVDAEWINSFIDDNSFEPGNRKTDVMYGFMTDAGIVAKRKLTSFGELITRMGTSDANSWALMLCNLAYTPAFQWYIKNIPFNETYYERQLDIDMGEDTTKKAKSEFWNGFKTILDTNEAFKEIGLGIPDITVKQTTAGEKKSMNSLVRQPWQDPDPRVILYSLYKFAEACGDYYHFTLRRLLDHDVDSAGISPTQIFGTDSDSMQQILIGLSINYPEFINASFTLDLDKIDLVNTKSSSDVLELF
ncbi:MAG: phosphoadenosine phosphosulfate reductase family protein [Oscillospiraceae bacterium]